MNGYSTDNYITDQDYFSGYTYRTMPANRNSCGCIAAYNLRRFLGHEVTFPDVLSEMDDMHVLKAPGPTTMNVMREYLFKYIPGVQEHTGRAESLEAARSSDAGVLRYNEDGMPHFICFIRSGEQFRFFNVSDGFEDFVQDMDSFFEKHCQKFRYTAVFTVNKQGVN